MLITMLVAATGANRTLLQRLLGGWALALAFWREAFACLDVAYSAAASLARSRRCRVSGALLDQLLFVTGLAPLLETNLRAEPCETDASQDGAGGVRRVHHAGGLARLVRFGRKGDYVRLD